MVERFGSALHLSDRVACVYQLVVMVVDEGLTFSVQFAYLVQEFVLAAQEVGQRRGRSERVEVSVCVECARHVDVEGLPRSSCRRCLAESIVISKP